MRIFGLAVVILIALAGRSFAGGMLAEAAETAPQAARWTGCYAGGGHAGMRPGMARQVDSADAGGYPFSAQEAR